MKITDIYDRQSLAEFLGISTKLLCSILYEITPDKLYRVFEIPKKNGGVRIICAPVEKLKQIQRIISKGLNIIYLNCCVDKSRPDKGIAHGFIQKRGIISNASNHRHKKFVINLDLKNYFDCFHFGRVRGFFIKNKLFQLSQPVSTMLAQLLCYQGKLPQGAPTSPIMTNFICSIMDKRLSSLAAKYHMYYTRYADDLTFSTNDSKIIIEFNQFLNNVDSVVRKCGFSINAKKTSMQYCDSRQTVTGLVVNNRIHVKREFIKDTWAMADHFYRNLPVVNNNIPVNMRQLEGRFSFINQLDKYENLQNCNAELLKKKSKTTVFKAEALNRHEKMYRRFLFYKLFYSNDATLLVTEGKTDPVYIKCAMYALKDYYPSLFLLNTKDLNLHFLNFTARIKFLLALQEGGNSFNNVLELYKSLDGTHKTQISTLHNIQIYDYLFLISKKHPKFPVILLYDNEQISKDKPLRNLLMSNRLSPNNIEKLKSNSWCHFYGNLFIATLPLINDKKEMEIEDLFKESDLNVKIKNKEFVRTVIDPNTQFGKGEFAKYVSKNRDKIDFSNFSKLLSVIQDIINMYELMKQNGSLAVCAQPSGTAAST